VTTILLPPSYLSPIMADDERRAKRSRFDQTEPEPRRASRFDRRSRSPSSRQPESTRTRSPLSREPYSPGADDSRKSGSVDPAAAAGMTSKQASKLILLQQKLTSRGNLNSCRSGQDQRTVASEERNSARRCPSHTFGEKSRWSCAHDATVAYLVPCMLSRPPVPHRTRLRPLPRTRRS
jgi:hypothetical protein